MKKRIQKKIFWVIGAPFVLLSPVISLVACSTSIEKKEPSVSKPIESQINLENFQTISEFLGEINNHINVFMPTYAGKLVHDGSKGGRLEKDGVDNILDYLRKIKANSKITLIYKGEQLLLDFQDVQKEVNAILSTVTDFDKLPKAPDLEKLLTYDKTPEMATLLADSVGVVESLNYQALLQFGGTNIDVNHYYQLLKAHHTQIWKLKNWAGYEQWVSDKKYDLFITDNKKDKYFKSIGLEPSHNDSNTPVKETLIPSGQGYDAITDRAYFGRPLIVAHEGQLQVSNLELEWVQKIMKYDGHPITVSDDI